MTCNCENKSGKQEGVQVPYIVYEGEMARNERHIRRLVVALIVAVNLIFASNIAWLVAWCQYDYYSEEVTVGTSGGGNANYIGNDGDIINGYNSSEETE